MCFSFPPVRFCVPPSCEIYYLWPHYPWARCRRNHCRVELGGSGVPTYRNRVVIFTNLSQFVQVLFIWALLLYDLFTTCLWLIHILFAAFSQFFTTCSRLALDLFGCCSQFFRTCSFVHYIFMTWSQLIDNLLITCSCLFHNFFTIFHNLFITCPDSVHNLFTIISQLVQDLFIWALPLHDLFPIGSRLVQDLVTTFDNLLKNWSQLFYDSFHNFFTIFSLLFQGFFIWALLLHDLFKIC